MPGFGDLLKLATGKTYRELVEQGAEDYPTLPELSRHHGSGAEIFASRFGFVPSQLAGFGTEFLESRTRKPDPAQDTLNDIYANLLGGIVGAFPEGTRTLARDVLTPAFGYAHGGKVPNVPTEDEVYQAIGAKLPPRPFAKEVASASKRHGVDPELLNAIIAVESSGRAGAFNPNDPSGGSRGAMQILLPTARGLGFTGPEAQLFNPATNIDLGAKYLAQQLARYGGNWVDAISAYNAGSKSTKNKSYVSKVSKELAKQNVLLPRFEHGGQVPDFEGLANFFRAQQPPSREALLAENRLTHAAATAPLSEQLAAMGVPPEVAVAFELFGPSVLGGLVSRTSGNLPAPPKTTGIGVSPAKRALTALTEIATGRNTNTLAAKAGAEEALKQARLNIRGLGETGTIAAKVSERTLAHPPEIKTGAFKGTGTFFKGERPDIAGRIEIDPARFRLPEQLRTVLEHEEGHDFWDKLLAVAENRAHWRGEAVRLAKEVKNAGENPPAKLVNAFKAAVAKGEAADEAQQVVSAFNVAASRGSFRPPGNVVREALEALVGRLGQKVSVVPHGPTERQADLIAQLASPFGRSKLPPEVLEPLARLGFAQGGVVTSLRTLAGVP